MVLFCIWVIFICLPKIVQPILGVHISCKKKIKIFKYIFPPSFIFLFFSFGCCFFPAGQRGFSFSSIQSSPAQQAWSSRAVAHPEGVRWGASPPLDRSNGWDRTPFLRGQVPAGGLLSQLRPRPPGACPRG